MLLASVFIVLLSHYNTKGRLIDFALQPQRKYVGNVLRPLSWMSASIAVLDGLYYVHQAFFAVKTSKASKLIRKLSKLKDFVPSILNFSENISSNYRKSTRFPPRGSLKAIYSFKNKNKKLIQGKCCNYSPNPVNIGKQKQIKENYHKLHFSLALL